MQKEEKKNKVFCFNKKRKTLKDVEKHSNKENVVKNGINLIRVSSKKSVHKNQSEKTRANDTISR